jgi:Ca2+-binding RTX toxin-like protein
MLRLRRVVLTSLVFVGSLMVLATAAVADGTLARTGATISYTPGPLGTSFDVDFTGLAFTFKSGSATAGNGCVPGSNGEIDCAATPLTVLQITAPATSIGSGIPASTRITTSSCNVMALNDPGPIVVNCVTPDPVGGNTGIFTGLAADVINVGPYANGQLDGGPSNDMITVTTNHPGSDCPGKENLCIVTHGGPGNDVIDASASTGDVYYDAGPGDDYFIGGSGNDSIVIGSNASATGSDTLAGGPGSDTFYDYPNSDGGDRVYGGTGNDHVSLMACNVSGLIAYSASTIQGGPGIDSFGYATAGTFCGGQPQPYHAVNISFDGTANDGPVFAAPTPVRPRDNILSVESMDPTIGGTNDGPDILVGNSDANTIHGHDGNDVITGGAGKDRLFGDEGNDTINATDGEQDFVYCLSGTDTVDADVVDTVSAECTNVTRH